VRITNAEKEINLKKKRNCFVSRKGRLKKSCISAEYEKIGKTIRIK
jgi:hypothetical protein